MASFFLALFAGIVAILLTAATYAAMALFLMSPGWFGWVIFGAYLTIVLHVFQAQARRGRA